MSAKIHLLLLFLALLLIYSQASFSKSAQSYIVYMGGSIGEDMEVAKSSHLQLLKSIIPSEEEERMYVNHVYHHSLRGFSALLTEEEASLISGHEEVISVFRDPTLKLHTTRSWDFLDEQSGLKSKFHYEHGEKKDVIIGVVDIGIWPESSSFSDNGMGEIPRRWKGVCMESFDFNKSNCNRKLIGARHYGKENSARDIIGHGTHTASTAAGAPVKHANYYGLAQGTARGGFPSARIAIYSPCNTNGCEGSKLMKAIDDAVKDGVDIISISIGSDEHVELFKDPIAIAAFHANQFGKMVVCSAGNSGPDSYTVVNTAPWIFTVAASSIDRSFESMLILGNKAQFKGYGITVSNLTTFGQYPLVLAEDVAAKSNTVSDARNCRPGSLNLKKVAGKIIVCVNNKKIPLKPSKMKELVKDGGALGLIYIKDVDKSLPFNSGTFPFTQIGEHDGIQIRKYIMSTKKPTATIITTFIVERFKPAPVVADFSSRGPGMVTENILKPDIMAPGVGILAAVPPGEDPYIVGGRKPSNFAFLSGTSMSCPHVSGAAAFIKSIHYQWTPSMIKSALMTTASSTNNARKLFTNSTRNVANPHEVGTGEISPLRALNPGLVFPTTTQDYFHFLCYLGYSTKKIKLISSSTHECSNLSKKMLISKINYPSVSIGKLKRSHARKVTRHVVNVGLNKLYVCLECACSFRFNG